MNKRRLCMKCPRIESRVKELESKASELKNINEIPKTAREPKKVSNIKKDSDDLPHKKSKPKNYKNCVIKFRAQARKTVQRGINIRQKKRHYSNSNVSFLATHFKNLSP